MIFDAQPVLLAQLSAQAEGVFPHRVQNAALPLHPAFIAGAEDAIEQFVRNHLRRQRAIASGPTQIALNTLAKGFLAHADLQRPEAALPADFGCDELIDGRSACATAGEGRSRHERTHRAVVIVAGTGHARRRIVEPGDDVYIVAERRERRQTGCQLVAGTGFCRYPEPLHHTISVKPQHESRFRRSSGELCSRFSGVGDTLAVKHRLERRQSDGQGPSAAEAERCSSGRISPLQQMIRNNDRARKPVSPARS